MTVKSHDTQLFTAHGRTAVTLPTAAILANFPLQSMIEDPFYGTLFANDFTRGEGVGNLTFKSSGGLIVEGAGAAAIGELIMTEGNDNEGCGIGWNVPITVSGGTKWAFGVRYHVSVVDDTKAGVFLGLAKYADTLAVASILVSTDNPPVVVDEAAVGFEMKDADGNAVDFIHNENTQTQQETSANILDTIVASTYHTLQMYYNGTTIQAYVDGVAAGTTITAANIAAATFPTGEIVRPCVAMVLSATAPYVVTLDWVYAIQSPV